MEGTLKWRADLGVLNPGLFGDPTSEWGHASSPVIFEDRVILQVDRHQDSYLAAFNLATGKRLWNVPRVERPVWSTPTLHTAGARTDLIVVGGEYVRSYDPRTGAELWKFKDTAEVKTPTPFVADDLIVFSGGYRAGPSSPSGRAPPGISRSPRMRSPAPGSPGAATSADPTRPHRSPTRACSTPCAMRGSSEPTT